MATALKVPQGVQGDSREYKITLAFVSRASGKAHKLRTFRGRNQFRMLINMAAWVMSYVEEYPPNKYRLVAMVDGDKPPKLIEWLRKNGIEIVEETVACYGTRTQ